MENAAPPKIESKQMDRDEMRRILEQPLDPDLEYHDATASIETMANAIRDMHALTCHLAHCMATQAQSIIDMRKEIIEIKADLSRAGVNKTGLIGLDRKGHA